MRCRYVDDKHDLESNRSLIQIKPKHGNKLNMRCVFEHYDFITYKYRNQVYFSDIYFFS